MQPQQHDLPTASYKPQLDTDATTNTISPQPAQPKWQHRLEYLAQRVAIPVNRLAVNQGCDAFVPTPMEEECAKAARIIRTFSYSASYPNKLPTQ